jgi:serine/threonine protein kinase
MQHPNIVQVHEVGDHEGQPFFSMELMTGGSLEQRLAEPWPVLQAVELIIALARAVHHAHQRNVMHRDLKPANVLFTADGIPKITDFGLAKMLDGPALTISGTVVGTPQYMAPEQAAGQTQVVGPATDVHALGVIFYQLLTGKLPFNGANLVEILDQVRFNKPAPPTAVRPGVPPAVEAVCLRCLEKEPGRRYVSVQGLITDLLALQDTLPSGNESSSVAVSAVGIAPETRE